MNILQILSVTIQLIKLAESLMPASGKGAEKLAFVKTALEQIFGVLGDNWPTIQSAIEVLVSLFNKLGVFKTSNP